MPTVDYFAGVNEGNKNLMAAMDTYGKEERQKGIDAMNAALHQKQLDQADFTLGEAKEKSKRNRETLADISRIGGMTEKIPSAISASPLAGEPKLSPGTVGPTPEGEYAMDEYTPGSQIQSIPAVNYTPQDKHTMMLESAIRNGDWETAAKVGQVVDVTQKIAAEQRTQLEAWAKNLKAFREAVKNPKAVAAFAKSSAATYGVDPALTEGIDFTATGDIIKSDGQGGTISIIEMPDGTFKEVHAKARDLVPTIGPDGKPVYGPKVAGAPVYEKPPTSKLLTPAEEEQRIRISKAGKVTGSEEAKEELAQSLARGEMTRIRDVMSLRSSGAGATALEIFNRARQINPKFSTAEIERKIKMESDFTTGKDGQSIQSFGTFLEHAGAANTAVDAINATNSPIMNKPINWIKKNVAGDANFQAFMVSLEPVRKEFEGFLLGGRALYAEDRKAAEVILNDNSSPSQVKSALKQMGHTAKARFQEVNYRYKRVMGNDIQEPFSPGAIQAAASIGVNLIGQDGEGKTIGPKVGEIQKGYKFKGGDPKDKNSWEQVR